MKNKREKLKELINERDRLYKRMVKDGVDISPSLKRYFESYDELIENLKRDIEAEGEKTQAQDETKEPIVGYDFTPETQKQILAFLWAKGYENKELLNPELFDVVPLRETAKLISSFLEKYKRVPTVDEAIEELRILLDSNPRLPEEEFTKTLTEVAIMKEKGTFEYGRDKALEFAEKQAMKKAILNSVESFKRGESIEKIFEAFQKSVQSTKRDDETPDIVPLIEVEKTGIKWLWRNRIPEGKITIITGNVGTGKSVFSIFLASHVSKGVPWPDNPDEKIQKGEVLILTAEDVPEDTIRPRVEANGGDLSKIHIIRGIKEKEKTRLFDLVKDVAKLEKVLKERPIKLLIIDPVTAYISKGVNSWKDQDVRNLLAPFQRLASDFSVTIVMILHLNKREDVHVINRLLDSRAWGAVARAVWLVGEDEETGERYFAPVKNNLARDTGSIFFEFEDTLLGKDKKGEEIRAPKLVYRRTSGEKAEDFIQPFDQKKDTKTKRAEDFLLNHLAIGKEVEASELIRKAEEEGIKVSTLHRARKKLGIKARREGGKEGKWLWRIE